MGCAGPTNLCWKPGSAIFSLCDFELVHYLLLPITSTLKRSALLRKFSKGWTYVKTKGLAWNHFVPSIYMIFWGSTTSMTSGSGDQAVIETQSLLPQRPQGRVRGLREKDGAEVIAMDAVFISWSGQSSLLGEKDFWAEACRTGVRALWLSERKYTDRRSARSWHRTSELTLNDGTPSWQEQWLDPIDFKSLSLENGLEEAPGPDARPHGKVRCHMMDGRGQGRDERKTEGEEGGGGWGRMGRMKMGKWGCEYTELHHYHCQQPEFSFQKPCSSIWEILAVRHLNGAFCNSFSSRWPEGRRKTGAWSLGLPLQHSSLQF